jgi:hypothetical protein
MTLSISIKSPALIIMTQKLTSEDAYTIEEA